MSKQKQSARSIAQEESSEDCQSRLGFDPETGEVVISRLDQHGHEVLDRTPLELPAGFRRPETLAEQVQRLVRTSISDYAGEKGYETFDEANDFDIEDDPIEPETAYEEVFDPVLGRGVTPREFMDNQERYRELYDKAGSTMTRSQLFEAMGVDPEAYPAYEGPKPSASKADLEPEQGDASPADTVPT